MTKPITILVAALGGEGGSVLADWLISAADAHDFPVQSTSIPGVAQRTGATTYYIEIYPVPRSELGGRQPVFSLTPNPGDVDVAMASELVEAARIVQNGFAHPQRTAVIASTHREYAVSEKMAMADGRYESHKALDALRAMARICVLFDMREMAWRNGTVINTVMFGAAVGTGVLPLSRGSCEAAIRASGKAVEASLKGFSAGYAVAKEALRSSGGGAGGAVLPAGLREVIQSGADLTADYQDERYARDYRSTVESLLHIEIDAGGGPAECPVTRETARFLALWMSYEDVIRVADLKTRRTRLEKVRKEVSARPEDVMRLTEFLKPGLEEMLSVLPPRLAHWAAQRKVLTRKPLNVGLHIRTDTVTGFMMLCALRSLRRVRRHTSRFRSEHELIVKWLDAIRRLLATPKLTQAAYELALSGNLVKGYGQTHARGRKNLQAILADIDRQDLTQAGGLAARIKQAREAALADPEGRKLAQALGLPVPEPAFKPINFVRNKLERV
jgi:indolepyruvate ferredoxin oxidoreductase beta subunit